MIAGKDACIFLEIFTKIIFDIKNSPEMTVILVQHQNTYIILQQLCSRILKSTNDFLFNLETFQKILFDAR